MESVPLFLYLKTRRRSHCEYSFHCRLYGSKGWRGSLRSLQAWPDRTDKNVAFNYKDKNIRCNAVAPGRVETNLRVNSENLIGSKTAHDKSIDNWRDIETKVSEGYITNMRKCTPDEIAKVVLFWHLTKPLLSTVPYL